MQVMKETGTSAHMLTGEETLVCKSFQLLLHAGHMSWVRNVPVLQLCCMHCQSECTRCSAVVLYGHAYHDVVVYFHRCLL